MALPTSGFPVPRTLLELFAGAAGLGLGLHTAIPGIRTVGYVEREAYAASVLVARMADALLDQAPIWDDVATFDGRPWCGVVDLLAGGFPCQDISVAGKGAGLAGKRSGLWSEFARIISEVRPRYVFIENVAALRSRGLDSVLSDLAALGFDAEWTCYRASDAGAPHRRDRIFILANAAGGERRFSERAFPFARGNSRENVGGGRNRPDLANANRERWSEGPNRVPWADGWPAELANPLSDLLRDESGRCSWTGGPGAPISGDPRQGVANTDSMEPIGGDIRRNTCSVGTQLGDPDRAGLAGRWPGSELSGSGQPRGARGASSLPFVWPPGPDDAARWTAALALRPDLEPAICRVADGLADRVDRLRVCGNGVVPIQAAEAFSILWDRMISE